MIYNDFKNLLNHSKPHNRFVIYNSFYSKEIQEFYKNILPDKEVVVQNKLEIKDGDLILVSTFGIPTQQIIENIFQFCNGNFFEIISDEILETYIFSKIIDSKDLRLEGTPLKRKGEVRHFLSKKIDDHYIYSPLKLWKQNIDTSTISNKLPESLLLDIDEIVKYRFQSFNEFSKLDINSLTNNNLRSWVVWGVALIFEIQLDGQMIYVEQENIIYDFTQIINKLEDFSQFLNSDFFEIDLQTGETSFYNPENLPEWVNKFLINSWRHGYFKYYYPELCV